MGIVGMSFKTTLGSEMVVGQYPSPWQPDIKTKAQYEQNFREITYTLGGDRSGSIHNDMIAAQMVGFDLGPPNTMNKNREEPPKYET